LILFVTKGAVQIIQNDALVFSIDQKQEMAQEITKLK